MSLDLTFPSVMSREHNEQLKRIAASRNCIASVEDEDDPDQVKTYASLRRDQGTDAYPDTETIEAHAAQLATSNSALRDVQSKLDHMTSESTQSLAQIIAENDDLRADLAEARVKLAASVERERVLNHLSTYKSLKGKVLDILGHPSH